VDSIRQVDVDLNFLLSAIQYCRSVSLSLFVRSTGYMLGKYFGWAEYIGCLPSVIVGWATATLPPRFPRLCANPPRKGALLKFLGITVTV